MGEVVCITGASGFIGSHLVKAIPDAHLFQFPENDLTDILDAEAFIQAWQPTVLYHLAAQALVTNTDTLGTLATNIVGTYNLYHACQKYATNLRSIVHISTDKVYGNNPKASRTDPLTGVDHPYNASKLCGDVVAQMYARYFGLPIRIIRTGNIYGPGDTHYDRLVPGTIKAFLENRPIELRSDGESARDFIFIDDLIPAYLRIADEPPGIYNLGGECRTVNYVVRSIQWLMNRTDLKPVIRNTQKNEIPFQHVVDCPDWWKPKTPLANGLRKTIEWHSKQA